jgi:hypothetical protein
MNCSKRLAVALTILLPAMCFSPPLPAMGPNPGGKLGEDMPFEGEDVVRRAPAATAEREGQPARTSGTPCPDGAGGKDDQGNAAGRDCAPAEGGSDPGRQEQSGSE